MYNLLDDPLIGVRTAAGERRMSLSELLAGLSAGAIEGYPGLRAHQADPWHVFLVQLAASIQARFPAKPLPNEAAYWRDGLLDLAGGKATAWQLLVEDVTQPAFFQHPWSNLDAEAKDYGVKRVRNQVTFDAKARTPDELDVLVTAKNHDVKMARIGINEAEAWLYALVVLQTTSGFLGAGNYGIVRMNGGFASRPIVAWVTSRQPADRFRAEVHALLDLRQQTIDTFGYAARGVVLTWLNPWNRSQHQHQIPELEPWFIETPRPIRLVRDAANTIVALGAASHARQIGPKTLDNGDVGDPWTPINTGDKKKGRSALTLSGDGFTPQRLTELIFEQGYELTAIQKPQLGDGMGWFIASCLVRGQGTTEGFHRIELPVPAKARYALLHKPQREGLGQLAQKLLDDAKYAESALATALAVLAEGGPEKADFERVKTWLAAERKHFGRRWEAMFFPTLWRGADEDQQAVRRDWQQQLVDMAHDLLEAAGQRLPFPSNRTWRAITQAQNIFLGMLRKRALPLPTHPPAQPTTTLEEPST